MMARSSVACKNLLNGKPNHFTPISCLANFPMMSCNPNCSTMRKNNERAKSRILGIIGIGVVFICGNNLAQGSQVSNVAVRKRAVNNPAPKVWYRVPEGYRAAKGRTWRTLVIFGGRNCAGSNEVSNVIGWARWADRHGVFIVAPGFKDDRYWEPQAWSGRALLNALSEIRRSYDINTSKLLYYGYSAGSQAANLFAAWRPDLCCAWVSHACGVFHEPSARMKGVPGLVTCGDADAARDILSRDFVAKARKVGQPVIWKSFPNHPHDVPPGSLALARACLGHWHETRCGELGVAGRSGVSAASPKGGVRGIVRLGVDVKRVRLACAFRLVGVGLAGRRELCLGVVPFRSLCRDGFVPLVGKAALWSLCPWRRVCHVSRTAVRADS